MDIESLMTNLAFPAAVAAFALWQGKQHEEFLQGVLTQTLKENTAATDKLSKLVQRLLDIYEKRPKEVLEHDKELQDND